MPTYDLDQLAARAGIVLGQVGGQQSGDAPGGTFELAERLGVSRKTVQRLRARGLDWWEADRYACAMGFRPDEVWPAWADEEPLLVFGAARANAAKAACPKGHAYSHQDATGRRRCRACRREAAARSRARLRRSEAVWERLAPVVAVPVALPLGPLEVPDELAARRKISKKSPKPQVKRVATQQLALLDAS